LFKVQGDIVPPMMSFAMFGAAHVENLVYFLTEIVKVYNIVFEQSKEEKTKCIKFNESVDLNFYAKEWRME
jgi:hypothetical protein